MCNALSIDLEDWYHSKFVKRYVECGNKSAVKIPTETLLGMLNAHNVKATFFVLGETATENPELIKRIYSDGHEIASHGFSHKTLDEIGPDGLRSELSEFRKVISDIIGGVKIKGFRAATFSLNHDTSWAVDILKEFDFKYDSSIFPMRIGPYGVDGVPLNVYGLNGGNIKIHDAASSLKEFPITVFEIGKLRFPVSGGFYLRAVPLFLQIKFLQIINKGRPFIIYLHPWECDKNIPRLRLNPLSRFISYYNIKSTLNKFDGLLENFEFGRIDNILRV